MGFKEGIKVDLNKKEKDPNKKMMEEIDRRKSTEVTPSNVKIENGEQRNKGSER